MKNNASPAAAALKAAGKNVADVAALSPYSHRRLSSGGTSAGNYLTAVLIGRDRITAKWEEAIREAVPQRVADEVIRLAAEAFEARNGR